MKIYISTTIVAEEVIKKDMISLAKYLEGKGHSVNKYKLTESYDSKQTYSEDALSDYHKKMMNSIKQCDMVIAEISTKSSGLGYEIAVALNERKPIMAIYRGSEKEHSSLSLSSNPSRLLKVMSYTSEDLHAKAEEFIAFAKEQIDTKFILIISPEIDKYLAWASDERRMHKAQIVRNAVEDMMHKDKDYKQFVKDQGSN